MTPERWRQVDDLFSQVVELPLAEQKEILARECASDPDLRREVEILLSHDATPATTQQLGSAVKSGIQVWAAKTSNLIGRHVGPYRVLEPLGQGGMGAVFLAVRDDDQFQRHVAIKLVRSDMDTSLILDRFRQERQILANLQHPNIAQLLDGGVTEDGLPYFAMEYVEGGKAITHHCRERSLSLEDRIRLFRQVCAAVQYAHQNLIVHRDLKPGNILVTPDGNVKLLDFGVAKLLENSPIGSEMAPTRTGMLMLTPEYASPEQVTGAPVTTASDVYMLGAVLYELLTGKAAHQFPDLSPLQVAAAITEAKVQRPSTAVLEAQPALSRSLAGDLDTIILTALHKDRLRRYSTVEAFSDDLRRYLEGLPVSARPDTVLYRASKFINRNRIAVTAGVVVAVSLVAGAGIAISQARRADRRFQEVRTLANTFLFDFHDQIQNLPGSTAAREFVVKTALEYLDRLSREAGSDDSLRVELAQAYLRVARVQGDPRGPNLNQREAAGVSLEKARALAESAMGSSAALPQALRVIAQTDTIRGDLLTQSGKAREGAASQRRAVEAAERLIQLSNGDPADWRMLNQMLLQLGDSLIDHAPDESMRRFERALQVAEQLPESMPLAQRRYALMLTHQRIGRASHDLGDPAQGIRSYQEAAKIVEELLQATPNDARMQRDLSIIYGYLGNYAGHPGYFNLHDPKTAVSYYEKARAIQERLVSGDSKDKRARNDLAIHANKLCQVLETIDPQRAVTFGRQCASLVDEVHERGSFIHMRMRQTCLGPLGGVLLRAGQTAEGLRILRESSELGAALYAKAPSDLGARSAASSSLQELGRGYLAANNLPQARQAFESALANLEKIHKEFPRDLWFLRDLALAHEDLGRVAQKAGDRVEARRQYQAALERWAEWTRTGKDGPFTRHYTARLQQQLAGLTD
jgi:serine/threonine protein kinase/tetratricopeptide (TPR) repeat protein